VDEEVHPYKNTHDDDPRKNDPPRVSLYLILFDELIAGHHAKVSL
jgi:hypothetical protein